MMNDGRDSSGIGTIGALAGRRSSRRGILAGSLKVIGGGALALAAGPIATRSAAAQDQGIGGGGRQGGDNGQGGGTGVVVGGQTGGADQGGGNRRVQGNAQAGVGGGGRSTTLPTVMAMPNTGAGHAIGSDGGTPLASLLLATGAATAATVAWRTSTGGAARDA